MCKTDSSEWARVFRGRRGSGEALDQNLVTGAEEHEQQYKWLEAAQLYERIVSSDPEPSAETAATWQRIGFCYALASQQASDMDDFLNLREKAVAAYTSAAYLFERNGAPGRSAQSVVQARYAKSWLATDAASRLELLEDGRSHGRAALDAFKNDGDAANYGRTCNFILTCIFDQLYYAPTESAKRTIAEEGVEFSDRVIAAIPPDNKVELVRAYAVSALIAWYVANIQEREAERKALAAKSVRFSERAVLLARAVHDPYAKATAYWARVMAGIGFTDRHEDALQSAQEMRQQGLLVKDNYLKGIAGYLLALTTDWLVPRETDPDIRRTRYEEIIRYAEEAIGYFQLVAQDAFIADTSMFYVQSYSSLAREADAEIEEKTGFIEKAVELGKMGREHAVRSGSPDAMSSTLHSLSKALQFNAQLDPTREGKTRLLEEALTCRRDHLAVLETTFPSSDWIFGVSKYYAAQITALLSALENEDREKVHLLETAIADMRDAVARCNRWITIHGIPSFLATVAMYEDAYGGILTSLYSHTKDRAYTAQANEVYYGSAEKFKRVELPSRAAESYWKIARNHDLVDEHLDAAKSFEHAFAEYKAAARRFSKFADFFQNYALYMRAWSEITTAKSAHRNDDHARAMENYESAATLLKKTKMWNHLASNFLAWAYLEQAECYSRQDDCKKAIDAFNDANLFFREAQKTLSSALERIADADEQDLAKRLIAASELRGRYCQGRIAVEEAKNLDRHGDHIASSIKYGHAAEVFHRITENATDATRGELAPLVYLCRAWQKMMVAEARASPIMYEEAAELFEQAKEHTATQQTSYLAQAHSCFCRALEAGTEFEITRDQTLYTTAKNFIGTAANFYLKAGFETASDYATATQRLFDAYVYIDNAKREVDPEKVARHYLMAEKVLERSAAAFLKAKHAEKIEQIQLLLQNVRDEKELALSLSEVLSAPTITSSTASFLTLTPTEEAPVGLERFEAAHIQAAIAVTEREIRLGQDFTLTLQILNVGKEPVQLSRIENLLPIGVHLVTSPTAHRFTGVHLDLKGKRLDPLVSEEITLTLRPDEYGAFEFAPRIVGKDESGYQVTHDAEPLSITVLETTLPGRITTGLPDLDKLLMGGIPENYAVILTSPSYNERDLLISRFLTSGVEEGQITFYLTGQVYGVKDLAHDHPEHFFLFVCNPRADMMIADQPNVSKMKGVENLTNIDIALTRACRRLDASIAGPRRACIDIVSDVLLQHHAVSTRRWLTGLIQDLKSGGFTVLVVLNPMMHPPEDVHAILGLFDGELNLYEEKTQGGLEKFVVVRKMYNQRYVERPLSFKLVKQSTG